MNRVEQRHEAVREQIIDYDRTAQQVLATSTQIQNSFDTRTQQIENIVAKFEHNIIQ